VVRLGATSRKTDNPEPSGATFGGEWFPVINLLRAAISDDRMGCPIQRMGVRMDGLARVDEPRTVDQPQHGLT
jgi:hypothetical protein